MKKHIVAGTAGHIDHGKTALVRALTGIDADRLEEEKRRGITIDIGFAHLELAPDLQLGFVDVPGHERFVKNMLAGITGIDLVMLVIAADESVMPQTREHFDICKLLGVRQGITVITKIDLVEPDLVDLVRLEAEDLAAGSFLEGAPVVPVSSTTAAGIDQLRAELEHAARGIQEKNSRHHFRLPIDRVFVMKGFGTVATGTLVSGSLDVESEVEVHPIRRRARVRGLQVHGEAVATAAAGQRTAVNLAGIDTEALHRGMVLAAPNNFEATNQIDCVFELLASAKPLKHRSPVHFHSGTAEIEAQVYFLDRRPKMNAGERAYVQFRLEEPTLVLPGDRFIVRRFSPVITIGGGTVLDSLAPRHRLKDPWRERLEVFETGSPAAVLAEHIKSNPHGLGAREIVARTAWLESDLERTAHELESAGGAVVVQSAPLWLAHRRNFQMALDCATDLLAGFHEANPLSTGMVKEELRSAAFPGAPTLFADAVLAELVRAGKVVADGDLVRLASHRMVLKEDEQQARDKIVGVFRDSGLTVPVLRELMPKLPVDANRANKLLQVLLREGELVRVSSDLVFHREAIEKLRVLLREQKGKSDRIAVPLFKDLAGISRKYAIPLLEYLDRVKVTRRVGDERIIL